MSRYDDGGWPAYVPVAERRRKAEREVAKLRKAGRSVALVRIEGRAIAATLWGRAWCDNLERYRDYETRLPRGRTYVRNGSVIDLQIGRCEVTALVSGSSIYKVRIGVAALPAAQWQSIRADCVGRIESLVEFLQGRLSKGVMDRMCRQGAGLFPGPLEISFSCTCEDHASMCKHVAAALYGVGARLDESPALLFRLRAVNESDLLTDLGTAIPTSAPAGGRVLAAEDVSALFGLDLVGPGGGDGGAGNMQSSRDTPVPTARLKQNAGRSRPLPPKMREPRTQSDPIAASAEAAMAQPRPPKPKASRPVRPLTAVQPPRPPQHPIGPGASTIVSTAIKDRTAVQLEDAKGLRKEKAEKLVADVIARLGKQLVTGLDVTVAGKAIQAASARSARTAHKPPLGSSTSTNQMQKPVIRSRRGPKNAI